MTNTAASSGDALLHGEESIIQGYLAPLAAGAPGALGLKDDCAFATPAPGHTFVLKTDAIAEGVHFLADDPPADIGWKALAVNVSDLAAKGARPVGYLMSLAFPSLPTRTWMAGFAHGLGEAQRAFGMHLLGGDTDRRPGPISITPMVLGEVPVGRMVRRGAARAGDLVCVTGSLGDAALGLALRRAPDQRQRWGISEEAAHTLVARYLRPQPRVAFAPTVLAHARAGMDISDGAMKDLGRMCRASGVGARVEIARMPVSDAFAAVRAAAPAAADAALFAGDDYEILMAVEPARFDQMRAAAGKIGLALTDIGMFCAGDGVTLIGPDGVALDTRGSGWDHF